MMQRRVAAARVGRLATVTPAGQPHVVPICFVVEGSRIVTALDKKPKSTNALHRFDNVRHNPAVSVLFDQYDEDWSQLWWVRVDGTAQVVERGAELDDALTALQEKYRGQYGLEPPSAPAIVIATTRWVGWSASG
jgi:PPOX class probable F420-dependent enzyme